MSYRGRDNRSDADRNRSRSREHSGGRGGNTSYGGRGPMNRGSARPATEEVMLNFFRLDKNLDDMYNNCTWFQYFVSVFPARRTFDDRSEVPQGTRPLIITPKDSRKQEGAKFEMDLDKGSTPLSRRILDKLRQEIFQASGTTLAVDGSNAAYAPKQLFETSGSDPRIPLGTFLDKSQTQKNAPSIYGPADVGIPTGGQQAPQVGLMWYYCIKAHTTCDENDPGAASTKQQWFIVRVREVGPVRKAVQTIQEFMARVQVMKQCLETMLKARMQGSDMISVGKSPHLFHLPGKLQLDPQLLGHSLSRDYANRETSFAPYLGVSQSIRLCQEGNVFLNMDVGLSWFLLEYKDRQKQSPQRPAMLLDPAKNTIAGVYVGNLHKPITDPRLAEEVRMALMKSTFHIRYTQPWSAAEEAKFRETLRMEGKDPETIEKKVAGKKKRLTRVLNNQTVMSKDKVHPGVVMAANNPDLHTFELTPRKKPDDTGPDPTPIKLTVEQYFRERKGLPLQYPCMPMIYTRQDGYFPVEFLRQAFGKMKDANAPDQVKQVLGFNDEFSSTNRIRHLERTMRKTEEVLARTDESASMMLSQFGVRIATQPLAVKAKVLPEPKIAFSAKTRGSLRDGSWNLLDGRNDHIFARPAKLMSFAVIDFAGSLTTVEKFMMTLTGRMKAHGMESPRNIDMRAALSQLTVTASSSASPPDIYDAFKDAIRKAKEFFLRDSSGSFGRNRAFFRSNVVSQRGETSEGIIFPNQVSGTFEVVLPVQVYGATHDVVDKNGETIETRKMVRVREHQGPLDMFDLYWDDKGHFTFEGRPVTIESYVWVSVDGSQFPQEAVARPLSVAEEWQIECPAVVFCQLPDDGAGRYNLIKLMSNFEFGVQSQCFLRTKFSTQRNPEQYCSNIALKLNAKLASKNNCAYAWNVEGLETRIPWLNQVPTMVMGLAMARASGQECQTVVAASVCLESGLQMAQTYRLQESSGQIEPLVLSNLTKNLAIQYYLHTGHKMPKRIIVYRNGSSEGNFEALLVTEVASIRAAFAQLRRDHQMDLCGNPACGGNGCTFCTPIITFIVALSQHSIRMVPKEVIPHGKSGNPRNVLSGTCVDNTINAYWDSMDSAVQPPLEDQRILSMEAGCPIQLFECASPYGGFDFLLTAHGGLKGTSKPIFYRVVLNENVVWKPGAENEVTPLTKDELQLMTYHMSYQYATATKAVRMVPVIYYSNKLANVAVGYIGYLTGKREIAQRSNGPQVLSKICSEDNDKIHFVRQDMEKLSIDESAATELLPKHSPYDPHLEHDPDNPRWHWRVPFATHISA